MKLKIVYIFAGVGIAFAMISAVLYLIGCDWSNALGAFSTVISIVLGLVSIVYTYVSGREMQITLDEIKKQNSRLVDKINYELSKDNYNEKNIEYIKSTIEEK